MDKTAWSWNWSSWDQEKIATFGDFQYAVYWDADQIMVLVRRDLRNNAIQTLRLKQCTLKNNDGHRNTCLGISAADGRLHLSWDHHCDQLRYTRSRPGFLSKPPVKIRAEDIESPQPMLSDPALESKVTYPRFIMNSQGKLFCTYRIGGSGNGDNVLNSYDPATATWRRLGMIFSRKGTYGPWENSTSRCAYLHDLLFDKRNRLHATWVYRETGKTWASNHDLHYAYSDDGGLTWYNNVGEKIADLPAGDPIALNDPGIVVVKIPVYSWLINAACMALDLKNRPHVVMFKSTSPHRPVKLEHSPPKDVREAQVFVHYWRDDDGTWRGGEPIEPGAPTQRPDIVFDKRNSMYFYWPTSEGFRCLQASAEDSWRKWTGYSLTSPAFIGRDASKHDRTRWREKGILSFTAKPESGGFAILDFTLATE
ncbi:MAG: BNR repeat-containing protein [Pirellulales bacterium]|nr:BNR repeat-containing protein [Pirellulales bacterium]